MIRQVNKARNAMADFRRNRRVLKNYTFGQQFDPENKDARDGQLTNNLIHRLVKTLIGHFRESDEQVKPDPALAHNRLTELDARLFEEFLISGAAIQHISHERRPGFDEPLTWVDNVSPDDFFAYPLRDPRAIDIEFIGMTRRWSLGEAIGRLAGGSRQHARRLREILLNCATDRTPGFERVTVIEVWSREITEVYRCHDRVKARMFLASEEDIPRIARQNQIYRKTNRPRIEIKLEMQTRWVGRFLAPDGTELRRVEADRHPFAVKFYPLLDGEVHSFVAGLIDQQKFVNRLVARIDNVLSTSAKGVLLFPENEMPEGMSWQDIADRWSRFDGLIPYYQQPGSPGPHQVVTNTGDLGAYQLLNIQMNFFDRISGVSNALKGSSDGGNSAQLYDAQTRNSLAAIADTFAAFRDFQSARNSLLP